MTISDNGERVKANIVEKGSPRWQPTVAEGVDEWANEMLADILGEGDGAKPMTMAERALEKQKLALNKKA